MGQIPVLFSGGALRKTGCVTHGSEQEQRLGASGLTFEKKAEGVVGDHKTGSGNFPFQLSSPQKRKGEAGVKATPNALGSSTNSTLDTCLSAIKKE